MDMPRLNSPETPGKIRETGLITAFRKNFTLRLAVQAFVVIVMIYAAWSFYGFYQYVQGFGGSSLPYRPPVVEGFLPIAAIVAFKAMFVTGQIDPIHPAGLVIFLAILLTGWLFRRALCSWICPLGTLSEYLGRLGKKLIGRNLTMPKWLDISLLVLKYGLLLYILRTILSMSGTDAAAFMQLPYYTVSDIKMFELFVNIGLKGTAFIGLMMVLSFVFRSFWCRYLCPYGAVVGILGLFSPVVLKKNSDTCVNCSRCDEVCPNRVSVEARKSTVISAECTGCSACVTACPKPDTLKFKLFGLLPVSPAAFGAGFIAVFFGIIVAAMLTGYWQSIVPVYDYQAIFQQFRGF